MWKIHEKNVFQIFFQTLKEQLFERKYTPEHGIYCNDFIYWNTKANFLFMKQNWGPVGFHSSVEQK